MLAITEGFAPQHKWDRNFFLGLILLGWVGIVMGFGGDMADHFVSHEPAYLPIVHIHAAAFVAWLVLITVQILLIRSTAYGLHKKLGVAMAVLAVAMVVLGPLAEMTVQAHNFGTKHSDPAFLAISFTEMTAFAGLIGAALALRKYASAHKRLMLMGTLYLTSAGFARWDGGLFSHLFGHGFWGMLMLLYACSTALILCIGLYDLITRRRLHPAFVLGLLWVVANEGVSIWLYGLPAWRTFATHIIGH